MKPILTIYQASNDTSVLYFENEEDAQKYAGSAGVCAGINVCPVAVIQSQSKNEITDLRIGDTLVSDIDFTKTEIVNPSKTDLKPLDGITSKDLKWEFQPNYSDPKIRPKGHYKIKAAFEGSDEFYSIAWWTGSEWLCIGDENEYWDNELNLKSIERVEL